MRNDRKNLELRKIEITTDFIKNADASCLIKSGDTHVVCTASIEEKVPRWLKGSGKGWVTAEYGMLPRSTHERMRRESSVGKVGGRTSEIQRLIGRSLRASMNLKLLGEYLITIDCDVLQADGGTRTASITGGFVALKKCIDLMNDKGDIIELQLTGEQTTCSEEEFMKMLRHSKSSIAEIITLQKKALSE